MATEHELATQALLTRIADALEALVEVSKPEPMTAATLERAMNEVEIEKPNVETVAEVLAKPRRTRSRKTS